MKCQGMRPWWAKAVSEDLLLRRVMEDAEVASVRGGMKAGRPENGRGHLGSEGAGLPGAGGTA